MAPRVRRTRAINTSRVLREIWINHEISRVEVARILGLDKSTVTVIVNELMEMGVIARLSEGASGPQGGRKPILLTVNPRFGCVLGFELQPESTHMACIDLAGNLLFTRSEKITVSGATLPRLFEDLLERTGDDLSRTGLTLLGIGVGVAGVVNPYKRVILSSIPLDIHEPYDFHEKVAERLGVPVFLDNDANCCSWGEIAFHRDKSLRDFLFVLVRLFGHNGWSGRPESTGVGMGIVLHGKVYYGSHYSAGEFRSVLRTRGALGQFSLSQESSERILEDRCAREAFFDELARNVALLVNTFDLSHVFLGGDIEKARDMRL